MATPEQLAEWVVNNQDKKGTPEFETVAAAYKQSKSLANPRTEPKRDSFGKDVLDVAGEASAAVNRGTTQALDFFSTDQVNNILQLAGSDKRIPSITELFAPATTGNNMDDGIAKDAIRTAGEVVPAAVGVGGAIRNASNKLPQMVDGAESVGRGVLRQMGGGTSTGDAALGALSGAGAEVGEEIGGEPGRLIGSMVTPLAPLGIKNATTNLTRNAAVNRSLVESAPPIERLRSEAKAVYKEIDDLGVTVRQDALESLSNDVGSMLRAQGYNPKIHPKIGAVMDEAEKLAQGAVPVSEVDILRRVARAAASSNERDEARLGGMIINKIDDFLDTLPKSVTATNAEAGPLYRKARGLWSKTRKSELIGDAVERARNQASGFENGMRTQFRSILNNKKLSRGFSNEELDAMRLVVRGGRVENLVKLLGKFGWSEGQATSFIGASIGAAAGATVAGPTGAMAVPIAGTMFKQLAQNLTRRNVRLADQLVRAGSDGRKIAAAYIRSTPSKDRSAEELTGLLLGDGVSIEGLRDSPNTLISNAAYLASAVQANAE